MKAEEASKFNPHNSTLIEELKAELRATTQCDSSWHSGVNDGMYKLLQHLIETDLIADNHKLFKKEDVVSMLKWSLSRIIKGNVSTDYATKELHFYLESKQVRS